MTQGDLITFVTDTAEYPGIVTGTTPLGNINIIYLTTTRGRHTLSANTVGEQFLKLRSRDPIADPIIDSLLKHGGSHE